LKHTKTARLFFCNPVSEKTSKLKKQLKIRSTFSPSSSCLSTMAEIPIVEFAHDLLGGSGKWAEQWRPGDVHTCWQDGHDFDGFPVTVPTSYDETRRTYAVFGKFCSWQCAKRWQMDHPSFNTPIARCWLATMAKEHFGYKHDVIRPAPKRWVLLSKQMTIEQYRNQCTANIPCETVIPPLLPACMASISGQTSQVLESIYTTRNNETIGGENTASPSTTSIYAKYLSNQQQPSAEEAQVQSQSSSSSSSSSSNSSSATVDSAPPPKKKKKSTRGGTLATYMRK